MESTPKIVYFSSVTENTKKFVDTLGFESYRLPLRASDKSLLMTEKYILFVPTYGGGNHKGAVPKQVIKFLNVEENRNLCVGVITGGNINFGEAYGLAGRIISKKLNVPLLYHFELAGTSRDTENVILGIQRYWDSLK